MSSEKMKEEARRWLETAKDDLDTARILSGSAKYAHCCFHAQQAGEKAMKAVWYFEDLDPWGHSIKKLIDDLESASPPAYDAFKDLTRPAMVLDRFYIPTRYPNGLPDITPDQAYNREDADVACNHADKIVSAAADYTRE